MPFCRMIVIVVTFIFTLQLLVDATENCIWCNKRRQDYFLGCLFYKIRMDPDLRWQYDVIDGMEKSLTAASSAMEKIPNDVKMNILNRVLGGEIVALVLSTELKGRQRDDVVAKALQILEGCYFEATGLSGENFANSIGLKVEDELMETDSNSNGDGYPGRPPFVENSASQVFPKTGFGIPPRQNFGSSQQFPAQTSAASSSVQQSRQFVPNAGPNINNNNAPFTIQNSPPSDFYASSNTNAVQNRNNFVPLADGRRDFAPSNSFASASSSVGQNADNYTPSNKNQPILRRNNPATSYFPEIPQTPLRSIPILPQPGQPPLATAVDSNSNFDYPYYNSENYRNGQPANSRIWSPPAQTANRSPQESNAASSSQSFVGRNDYTYQNNPNYDEGNTYQMDDIEPKEYYNDYEYNIGGTNRQLPYDYMPEDYDYKPTNIETSEIDSGGNQPQTYNSQPLNDGSAFQKTDNQPALTAFSLANSDNKGNGVSMPNSNAKSISLSQSPKPGNNNQQTGFKSFALSQSDDQGFGTSKETAPQNTNPGKSPINTDNYSPDSAPSTSNAAAATQHTDDASPDNYNPPSNDYPSSASAAAATASQSPSQGYPDDNSTPLSENSPDATSTSAGVTSGKNYRRNKFPKFGRRRTPGQSPSDTENNAPEDAPNGSNAEAVAASQGSDNSSPDNYAAPDNAPESASANAVATSNEENFNDTPQTNSNRPLNEPAKDYLVPQTGSNLEDTPTQTTNTATATGTTSQGTNKNSTKWKPKINSRKACALEFAESCYVELSEDESFNCWFNEDTSHDDAVSDAKNIIKNAFLKSDLNNYADDAERICQQQVSQLPPGATSQSYAEKMSKSGMMIYYKNRLLNGNCKSKGTSTAKKILEALSDFFYPTDNTGNDYGASGSGSNAEADAASQDTDNGSTDDYNPSPSNDSPSSASSAAATAYQSSSEGNPDDDYTPLSDNTPDAASSSAGATPGKGPRRNKYLKFLYRTPGQSPTDAENNVPEDAPNGSNAEADAASQSSDDSSPDNYNPPPNNSASSASAAAVSASEDSSDECSGDDDTPQEDDSPDTAPASAVAESQDSDSRNSDDDSNNSPLTYDSTHDSSGENADKSGNSNNPEESPFLSQPTDENLITHIEFLKKTALECVTLDGYNYKFMTLGMASVGKDIKEQNPDKKPGEIIDQVYLLTILALTQLLQDVDSPKWSSNQQGNDESQPTEERSLPPPIYTDYEYSFNQDNGGSSAVAVANSQSDTTDYQNSGNYQYASATNMDPYQNYGNYQYASASNMDPYQNSGNYQYASARNMNPLQNGGQNNFDVTDVGAGYRQRYRNSDYYNNGGSAYAFSD